MYRLLALDIDDTLTKEPRTVPEDNLRAIKEAQEAGIFVTVATGRGFHGSSHIWKMLGVQGPVINYGGAIIMDTRTGGMLHSASVTPDEVREALLFAKELGVHAHIYQGDRVISGADNEYLRRYVSFLDLPCTVDKDILEKTWDNVPKVLYMTEPESAPGIIAAAGEKFAGRLKVSASKPGFIEINNAEAHKGAGLKWTAGYLGIKQSEVVAVGDNTLDLEMIEWAGLGAAVGDGNAGVKACADIIAPNCADGAVAWVIREVMLK